jgi:hypothetical protein
MDGKMQGMWKNLEEWVGDLLRKFLYSQRGFPPCANVWCGECYHIREHDPFPIQEILEEDMYLEMDPSDERLYWQGREGNHLMCVPFECNLCHFRNLTKRNPIRGGP